MYTEKGLRKAKLDTMKHNYRLKARMSDVSKVNRQFALISTNSN